MKAIGKVIFFSAGVFLALTLTTSLAWAVDDQSSQETLVGLKGVRVVIEPLKPEIESDGLKESQIQNDIESKLKNVGIKILTRVERLQEKGRPSLYMNTNIFKSKRGFYVYDIDIELNQKVILVRNPNIGEVFGSTWSTSVIGITPNLNEIRNEIKELMEDFLNAWQSVNPKK